MEMWELTKTKFPYKEKQESGCAWRLYGYTFDELEFLS
jgi:hypothetical protein